VSIVASLRREVPPEEVEPVPSPLSDGPAHDAEVPAERAAEQASDRVRERAADEEPAPRDRGTR
jgi:hypothetical protein